MRLSHALLSLLALVSPPAFALPEADLPRLAELLHEGAGFLRTGSFEGEGRVRISYTRFGTSDGSKGCVLVAPGRGEPALKYAELAHDLVSQGYSPVYAIDHRGQGLSGRLLADSHKGHVEKFKDYVTDLQLFVGKVLLRDPACARKDRFLLGHSMGGAIAVGYLETVGGRSPFRKVALAGPMMGIAFPGGKTEFSVLLETWLACYTPFGPGCTDYIPGEGSYTPRAFESNDLTGSEARFRFHQQLLASRPELALGGPTVRWVRESVKAGRAIRRPKNVARISGELLILQAGNDTVVDNSAQNEFCGLLKGCRIERLPGAKHELLMERDSIRNHALATLLGFFQRH